MPALLYQVPIDEFYYFQHDGLMCFERTSPEIVIFQVPETLSLNLICYETVGIIARAEYVHRYKLTGKY